MKKRVVTCVGTRPNFIKVTQLDKYFKNFDIEHKLIHTGQHFDTQMSEVFFKELHIKTPDIYFNLVPSTQISIVSQIMLEFEKYLSDYKPDLVLVPGDVNSSFACAFVANRMGIPVGHIESGLRSFDRSMPEEINRILIDDLSDIFFITEESGKQNLINERKDISKMKFTGNTMIDSLVAFLPLINQSAILTKLRIEPKGYIIATFHRPQNVDTKENLSKVIELLNTISEIKKVVFPIHPRTKKQMEIYGLLNKIKSNIILVEPLGYIDFIHLIKNSFASITDSGGIQEETTFLGIPCFTIRSNTERPITVSKGSNTLVNLDNDVILDYLNSVKDGNYKQGLIPELWDGKSSERIVNYIVEFFN